MKQLKESHTLTYTTNNTAPATLHFPTLADHYAASLKQFGSRLLDNPRHHHPKEPYMPAISWSL
ncbi:hypothetical protein E2C01_095472 [Portunus trituberculatus]|uniref:Uncharacterized protein n=1 Tax=Portunus trituberculatus TaxID=210409 RepID=A0A5B7K085_PORTR|nr:hypothetical protein [Portunus trituberculatus]